jgi:quercetin dioxygenase-like cupin family protein
MKGRRRTTTFALAGLAACAPVATVNQQAAMPMDSGTMEIRAVSALTWSDLQPTGFNPGMKVAVLHGDPGAPGPYTIRLLFPAGYEFPVHWHPGTENLTVVSGSFLLGMGTSGDRSAQRTYGPGDYLYIPGRMPHYGGARDETVIQLHGIGPFAINLGSP